MITNSILTALNLGYTAATEPSFLVFVPGTHQALFNTQEFLGQAEYRVIWNRDMLLVDVDTREVKRILTPGEVELFSVSPKGKSVAIQTANQVNVVDLTGKVLQPRQLPGWMSPLLQPRPQPTQPPLGASPSAAEQAELKAIVQAYIEIRYRAPSVTVSGNFKTKDFGWTNTASK